MNVSVVGPMPSFVEFSVLLIGLAAPVSARFQRALLLSRKRRFRYYQVNSYQDVTQHGALDVEQVENAQADVIVGSDCEVMARVKSEYPQARFIYVDNPMNTSPTCSQAADVRLHGPLMVKQIFHALDSCVESVAQLYAKTTDREEVEQAKSSTLETAGEKQQVDSILVPRPAMGGQASLSEWPTDLLDLRPSFPGGTGALIVDDNRVSAELLSALLTAFGIRAHIANSGIDALELAQESRYDLLFCDAIMPVVDGFSLCRSVKDVLGSSAPRMVLLNDHCGLWFRHRARACGALATLTKPVDPHQLSMTVSTLFSDSLVNSTSPSIQA